MWYYQTQEGNAGQNKRPGRLKDLEDHSIKSLVREVIQNSLDVKLSNKPLVKLKFRIGTWQKTDHDSFLRNFSPKPIDVFKESFEKAQDDTKLKMNDGIKRITNFNDTSYYLIIEEENCVGLTGSVNGYEGLKSSPSNFNSLMRMVDDNETKKENPNSGGTWGKGSSVFTFSSSIWLWFSYSELSEPWKDPKTGVLHKKRFMGRCAISPFYDVKKETTMLGEGWYCNNGKDVYPFINNEADDYASRLGFDIRNNNFGTTFFIPFFNAGLENKTSSEITEELRVQILSNWFIPIYKNGLSIDLITASDVIKINRDYLSEVPELKYKLDLLNWYYGSIPKKKETILETFTVTAPKLKPDFKRNNNQFALIRHQSKVDLLIRLIDDDEDFNDNWGTENKIALARNRGMIVNHYLPIDTAEIRFESILLAGLLSESETDEDAKKHLDLFLAYSENPSHNKWCHTKEDYPISFLERFDGKSPRPETLLYNMFSELSKIIRRFIVKEKISSTSKEICDVFKKLTRLKNQGSDNTGKSLFFLRRVSSPEIDSTGRFVFTYRVISNCTSGNIVVNFKSKINSLEGEKDTDFDVLGISGFETLELFDENLQTISENDAPTITLHPEEQKIIKIRTCSIAGHKEFNNIEPIIKASANPAEL